MWRDIGLGDWLFDLEIEEESHRIPAAVLAMARDLAVAKAKTEAAGRFVSKRQQETMNVLRDDLMRIEK